MYVIICMKDCILCPANMYIYIYDIIHLFDRMLYVVLYCIVSYSMLASVMLCNVALLDTIW